MLRRKSIRLSKTPKPRRRNQSGVQLMKSLAKPRKVQTQLLKKENRLLKMNLSREAGTRRFKVTMLTKSQNTRVLTPKMNRKK